MHQTHSFLKFTCIFLEYVFDQWHINNATGKKEREVTYKAEVQSMLGINLISCDEIQVGFIYC